MSTKQGINRKDFLSPLYNEAIIHNGLVYCSGKVGIDYGTGKLVDGTVGDRTKVALRHLEDVLKAAGSDLSKLLKVTIYITSIDDYAAMNEAYIATIPDPKPVRSCVTVADLGKGADVEIDCIASLDVVKQSAKL